MQCSETARTASGRYPHRSTVLRLINKFETTGSVTDEQRRQRSGRPSLVNKEEFRAAVLREMNDNRPTSTRLISRQLAAHSEYNACHETVRKTLIKMGRKPYHPRLVHAINEDDPDRRIEACETLIAIFENDPASIDRIFWTDEATFKLNGHINRHNCVFWNTENLHHILEKDVNLPGVTVWCAISSNGIIGPYFHDGTVNSHSYLNMLQNWFMPRVAEQDGLLFQQDGAPPHYALIVRQWLNDTFPGAWIGRRGPMEWPARSPDLTPCDFFLWGVLKQWFSNYLPRASL
ncbi:MAG: hypothetical protein ACKE51_03370 [Methylococcaceae bacterium]